MALGMTKSMEDLRAPQATWGAEVKLYETEKRRVIDEGLVGGPQLRLRLGAVQTQERVFDPLLQRYRSEDTEYRQRFAEEKARVAHLNRSQDIQILREQPFHIINGSSKLEAIAPGADPVRLGGHGTLGEKRRTRNGQNSYPISAVDYNITSNLPLQAHHWAPPDARPMMQERSPKARLVPAFAVKDYNIVTNKYLRDHETKAAAEKHLNLLEATHKHMKQRAGFDPISQQFGDPTVEETVRTADTALQSEIVMRAQSRIPPSYKGRESEFFNVTTHEAKNKDMLQLFETLEKERKERFRNRYIVEHNLHAQDVKGDHIREARRLNRIAPERYEEPVARGYDIIENKAFGNGPKCKQVHEPMTKPRATVWEKALHGLEPEAIEATLQPKSSSTWNPSTETKNAKTLKMTASGSESQLRRPSSSRTTSTVSRSKSLANFDKGSVRSSMSAPPPPTLKLPGGDVGSVYSRAA